MNNWTMLWIIQGEQNDDDLELALEFVREQNMLNFEGLNWQGN